MRALASLLLILSLSLVPVAAQEFQGGRDCVPEGKPKKQRRISTVDQCRTACASDERCKAYAFQTLKPACYFYARVFMGGAPKNRRLGLYSSGLSILPKPGFVYAFKRSSFLPAPVPVPVQPPM
jgi:hypothetical protein